MGNDTLPSLVTDNRFVIIPQWILFSGISDGALRLYAVLMKYAASVYLGILHNYVRSH